MKLMLLRNKTLPFLLRFATLIVVMMAWTAPAMAQAQVYSGVYYIASDNTASGGDDPTYYSSATDDKKYYLVPADDPHQSPDYTPHNFTDYRDAWYSPNHATDNGDPEKPFLTTYKTNKDAADVPSGVTVRAHNSVWIVKKTSDNFYYVIHAATGKYVIYEVPSPNASNNHRKTMHLQTPDDNTYSLSSNENYKFIITKSDDIYRLQPKNRTEWYWNPANGNKDKYYGQTKDIFQAGLVGVYNSSTDGGSKWHFESTLFAAPTINDINQSNNTVTITPGYVPVNCQLVYTTDGEDPSPSHGTPYSGPISVTGTMTIKAAVVGYGMVLSNIASREVTAFSLAQPTFEITCDNKLEIICSNLPEGGQIRYTFTTDGSTPATPTSSSTLYEEPVTLASGDKVKAKAFYGLLESEVSAVHTHSFTHTEAPTITTTSATEVTITGPSGSTIYYTTNGIDPVIGQSGVNSHSSPVTVDFGGNMTEFRAIAKTTSLEVSCVVRYVTMGRPDVTIEADACTVTAPRGNVIVIQLPSDGSTVWYAVTAGENSEAPDIHVLPNPYSQYTGDVVLDDLDSTYTYYTVHAYAKSSDEAFVSSITSVSHEMKTGGKPELTPPVGSSPTIAISGGAFGDVAICSADGVASQNIPIASDGTAEYTIPAGATGTLTVVFKHGNWLTSCEATYTIPNPPAAPVASQTCDNKLRLSTTSPMATIHYILNGEESDEVTLSSPTYFAGCLDTITPGTRVRAKAFEGFLSSALLDYTYQPEHVAAPTFFVDGNRVTIRSATSGASIYYTISTNGNNNEDDPIADPADPDPTNDDQLYTTEYILTGITKIKAIAVKGDMENSCIILVTTREGYSITNVEELNTISGDPDKRGKYWFIENDFDASDYNGPVDFTGVVVGNFHTLSGLTTPLFNETSGNAVVRGLNLKEVNIPTNTAGNVGAIARVSKGNTRIYNCGILPTTADGLSTSQVGGIDTVGGLVGVLKDNARVINSFSYANITSGTYRGGIVGYNTGTSTQAAVTTMIMNCMFYGDISTLYEPEQIAPVYGGVKISNSGNTGLNNFNYFRFSSPYVSSGATLTYNCALGAKDRNLERFEFYRLTLNSNHELASWYIKGTVTGASERVGQWVIDKNVAPYPTIKTGEGVYPSIINPDAANAVPIDPDNEHRNEGRKLGELTVYINSVGSNAPTGAAIKPGCSTRILNIIDKDEANYNFNYKKVQLPYYNEVGTNNYTSNKVVTGWKITAFDHEGTGTFCTDNYDDPCYNFVDRSCTDKDKYSVSGRVFNQGAYYEVPDGVTEITIEPYWANCVYLSDSKYDVTYNDKTACQVSTMGSRPDTFNGNQKVYNAIATAISNLTAGATVYDAAVVLVGNYHHFFNETSINPNNTNGKPLTIMSADMDNDNEPDNSFFYQHYDRREVKPLRFDFINVPGIGMAQKEDGREYDPQPGIFHASGWFEITNTVLISFGQFEFAKSSTNTIKPIILHGGIYEQYVSTNDGDATYQYMFVGGNAWFKEFNVGCHTRTGAGKTPKHPVSVAGGDFEKFYLSGRNKPEQVQDPENAECYIDGGRFGEVAGACMQQIDGNVTWRINGADITSFFGGGVNYDKPITGTISTTISNSWVDEFCGGPKFGNMASGKAVTTEATNCHFGKFFGAGYGGTAFNRKGLVDESNQSNYDDKWNSWVGTHYKRAYNSTYSGVSTSYEYEYFFYSGGRDAKKVGRFYVNFASLSLASTQDVSSTLTGCTIGNFYGGGKLGSVNGDVVSTLTDCTVTGDVFGSGYSAAVPTVEVTNRENSNNDVGFETKPYYDNTANVFNDEQVSPPVPPVVYTWNNDASNFNLPTSYFNEERHLIYTNQNLDNLGAVLGNATLTINGNTVVKGDVYGGGALSSSNTNSPSNVTRVNINGGTYGEARAATGGNIYGGGMGNEQNAVTEGTVEVNIGNSSQSANSVVINGSVYGCNNANGSPKDNVTVNVYTTKHNSTNIVTGTGFAISQVFGGGNQAHYTPTSADKKTTVHIHNCDNTIQYVYGGGNAANVGTDTLGGIKSATHVIIDGGRIEWVFGGGNGAGEGNPGANIYNDVNVEYHAGDITYLFGGSNEKGLIGGSKNVSILNDLSCAIDNHIAELYGGNNKAHITGGAGTTLTMPCTSNPCAIDYVFGGSREANISGDVVLNIEGGEYDYVFGGNNISGVIDGNVTLNLYGGTIGQAFGGNKGGGSITGNITVNVEDHGLDCPLEVHHVFGAGDLAEYTAPTGLDARDYNPMVYVNHLRTGKTVTGNVYGGGNGNPDDDTQVPGSVTGNPMVIIGDTTTGHESYRAAISGNVYGGGNAAKVVGPTKVVLQKANSTVGGDIYGGGNLAHVTGSSNVNVLGGTVSQDVYGGGALANVGTSNSDSTIVTISGGTIRDVYGGGLGQTTPTSIAALVNGKVKVKALGGTISNMFGCNNVNGAPQSTVQVIVNDTTTAHNLTIGNVYGGGNLAAYSGTPDVDINNGTVTGRVFGGGNQAGVSGGDVTMIGGTVNGGLYGGCNTSGTITNDVTVHVTGGTIGTANVVNGAVYGGGLGEDTKVKGNVTVTIDGGTFNNDVYGGSAKGLVNCDDAGTGATEGSKTDVTLNAGTINGSLYGGGHGINGADAHVWGPVQVTVNSGTVTGSVYGCNNASGAPQSTVKVDIYDTDHPGSGYALGHVFGGGNQADYTAGVPTVKVHGCSNSINYVYGGGNAAAVNGTDVTIYGGNSIAHVFGGCYGANVTTSGTDVKIYGGTIDTIYGGNNESGSITGDIRVTVNKQPEHANDSCAMHIKEVYGGGNKAASNAGQITIAYTGYDSAERINYVYGGANRANVTGPIDLTIREGRIDNVFGGNNNSGEISGNVTVTIEKDKTTPARVWEIGNVFGGGNLAEYSGTPSVNVKNGVVTNVFGGGNGDPLSLTHDPGKVGASNVTIGDATSGYKAVITGNVYGGGNAANVTGATSISLTPNSTVNTGVYGGCNTQGNVGGDITVTVNCDSIGSRAKLNTLVTSDVFGGGYGQETSTSGDVVVNINGGIIYGDVYGGSALGEVNGGSSNTTIVNVTGGTLNTIETTTPGGFSIYNGGNVFGGGLGRKDDPDTADDETVEAKVNGTVTVNIGKIEGTASPDEGDHTGNAYSGNATIQGNVYGCNNTNGSPQEDVTVNIYQTAHTTTDDVDYVEDDGVNGPPTFAINNVFGGGNEADFRVNKTTTVNVFGCDNTIERTFGGGNAAATNSVITDIKGGRIHDVFGGGNGEVSAADIYGDITLGIHGGTIGQSYSISNQNGVVTGGASVVIDNAGCGGVEVEEHFMGGNFANVYGDLNSVITCEGGMVVKNLYGGCKQADVLKYPSVAEVEAHHYDGTYPDYVITLYDANPTTYASTYAEKFGNVHLTVNGGTYENVYGGSQGTPERGANIEGDVQLDIYGGTITKAIFGGSHIKGSIGGKIIVNVEDKYPYDACALDVSIADVYGGGNQANYPGEGITHDGEYNYPQVNIKNATVKNVFGGALEAEVTGNPQIKIKKGSKILGNVYGGGNMGEVDGDPKVIINGKLE